MLLDAFLIGGGQDVALELRGVHPLRQQPLVTGELDVLLADLGDLALDAGHLVGPSALLSVAVRAAGGGVDLPAAGGTRIPFHRTSPRQDSDAYTEACP